MDGDLLLVGAILAVGVGLWAFEYHLDRQYLARVQAGWEREVSHFTPTKATRYLVHLDRWEKYEKGPTGVLGLSDRDIVFSDRYHDKDVRVPFEAVRWVGMREIEYIPSFTERLLLLRGPERARDPVRKRALIVDCEFPDESGPDRWPVYAWSLPQQDELGATLAKLCRLEISTEGGDFGPSDARRLIRGSDAKWQEYDQGALYLAPDRLLFNWDDPILYSSIQRVEAISTVGRNRLFSQGSFRIDYCDADGTAQTVGFQVFRGNEWAEQLRSRCYASHKAKPMWDKSKEEPIWDKLGQFDPPSG
jgi:hypothetical protein